MKKVTAIKNKVFTWLVIDLSFISIVVLGLIYFSKNFKPVCANAITCTDNLTGKYEPETEGEFMGKVISPPSYLAEIPEKKVLGEAAATDNKHIFIDLATQTLYAYQGEQLVYTFLISSGKWNKTPTGDFKIWIKLRYTKMSGGSQALHTYYYLPNVPFVMYFYNDKIGKSMGYGLHGTYWHENFGHPMSHGCINMKTADAETLFYWTSPPPKGNLTYVTETDSVTPITIYGTPPTE